MEAVRESWTDARLDDGFDRVAADIKALRRETGEVKREVGDLRKGMHEEIGGLRKEMHEEIGGLRKEMHEEVGSLREETTSLRVETTSLRRDLNSFRLDTGARFERLEGRFDDLQRTLMLTGGGIIAALIGVIATQL